MTFKRSCENSTLNTADKQGWGVCVWGGAQYYLACVEMVLSFFFSLRKLPFAVVVNEGKQL